MTFICISCDSTFIVHDDDICPSCYSMDTIPLDGWTDKYEDGHYEGGFARSINRSNDREE